MKTKLSAEIITSFVGDVLPLWLVSDGDLKFANISWSVKGDAVKMKKCGGCFHGAFSYGVFLTFVKAGEACVKACCDGVEYVCNIKSSKRKRISSEEAVNYYLGDFHSHTTREHIHDKFLAENGASQAEYVNFIKSENLRDVAVITDHSETIDLENFFRGFAEYELAKPMCPIVYPGCENEVMFEERDRFGRAHRASGELIVINADNFCQAKTYPEFFSAFEESPFAIGIFAHPHVVGISTMGVWDYKPRYQYVNEFRNLIKYIEVLNSPGTGLGTNILHEYVYSDALDAGCRVSTICGSDQHGDWYFDGYMGKTVIMAPEKTREAITDALLNLRAYACESENIKLRYSVNGRVAPCDLEPESKYRFNVKIGYFRDDNSTRPVRCELISDGGRTIKTVEDVDFDDFSFEIESDTARWFYLRFVDSEGRRTWSPPVFSGREYDLFTNDGLTPIDRSEFTVTDEKGSDTFALNDGDTYTEWSAEGGCASLTVDMGRERRVSALGCYAVLLNIQELRARGIPTALAASSFPVDYRISVSRDGAEYECVKEGLFRSFAGEDIVRFDSKFARFIKLEILSTTGTRYGKPPYSEMPLKIAEISVFE
ncbi:MAG: discoidin domain-containing protein [Ruminococcaceae bacterium]|nr:discoidin domain-containing protein [Oscillospiraceae bacterium]